MRLAILDISAYSISLPELGGGQKHRLRHIEVERFVALRLTADCIGRAAPNKEGDGACGHREREEKHDRPGRSDFVPCRPGAEPWQDYRVFDLTRGTPWKSPTLLSEMSL